uniref:Ligand-gated ion channel 50 n=1 Tax=Parascaris univalens TaxID=6257 RepID=A0A915BEY1_PARUN
MDLYVNEIWHDSKLAFGHLSPCKGNLTLNEAVLSRLWTPNTCFVNSKVADIHDSPSRNIYLTLFSNGTVWVNYRVRVKGPCSMDLSNFPMDTQTCLLIYESFVYNSQEVRMRWNADRPDPVYMLRPINLPDFDIEKIDPVLVRVVYPAGLWDELHVRFTFKRRCAWYFLQSYVPTYLTIFISWIAFSLGPSPKAVQARTMLGVNALLAIIMQFGSTLRKLPRVSYVKAIDVWLLGSMTFIFLSLVELAIVGLKMRGEVKPPSSSTDCCCSKTSDPIRTVHRIDSCAKIIFPAVYSVFNIVYWAYYGLLVQ